MNGINSVRKSSGGRVSYVSVKLALGILYIRMAKRTRLRLSQCAIRKYDRHIGSVTMSDDRGSILGNHRDFTVSVNLYYLWY